MKKIYMLLAALALPTLATSCVQMPTERATVVDTRPQLSFKVAGDVSSMTVYIDGLDMGSVADYQETGKNGGDYALRILPGTHLLRVERSGVLIHEEKLYVADGVSKVIQLP